MKRLRITADEVREYVEESSRVWMVYAQTKRAKFSWNDAGQYRVEVENQVVFCWE